MQPDESSVQQLQPVGGSRSVRSSSQVTATSAETREGESQRLLVSHNVPQVPRTASAGMMLLQALWTFATLVMSFVTYFTFNDSITANIYIWCSMVCAGLTVILSCVQVACPPIRRLSNATAGLASMLGCLAIFGYISNGDDSTPLMRYKVLPATQLMIAVPAAVYLIKTLSSPYMARQTYGDKLRRQSYGVVAYKQLWAAAVVAVASSALVVNVATADSTGHTLSLSDLMDASNVTSPFCAAEGKCGDVSTSATRLALSLRVALGLGVAELLMCLLALNSRLHNPYPLWLANIVPVGRGVAVGYSIWSLLTLYRDTHNSCTYLFGAALVVGLQAADGVCVLVSFIWLLVVIVCWFVPLDSYDAGPVLVLLERTVQQRRASEISSMPPPASLPERAQPVPSAPELPSAYARWN